MNRYSSIVIVFLYLLVPMDDSQGQWVETYGPYGGVVQTFAVSGTNLLAGTIGAGVFLSTNNGNSWTAVNTGMTDTNIYALAVHGNTLFAGTQDSGIFLSTNNGASWIPAGPTHPNVRALVIADTNLFAGTWGGGVFRSTDNGSNWTAVNAGITNFYISSFAISPNETGGTNIFAGTFGGGVFLSTNNGTSWKPLNSGSWPNLYVYCLSVGGSFLYAASDMGYGMVYSSDNGATWDFSLTGLTNNNVTALVAKRTDVFAGTFGGGVFRSINDPKRWTKINTGLTNLEVVSLGVDETYLYAGTAHGAWRRLLSEITAVQETDHPLPMQYSLEQNYPNPFNPTTNFQFSIINRELTILKVYDVLGREVATLVDEVKDPGTYTVEFSATGGDGSGLPSGVYFYELQSGTFTAVKKMLLMR